MATGLGALSSSTAALAWPSCFSSSGITGLNSLRFQANMKGQFCRVWDGLHVNRIPKNSSLKKGKALHILCMVSASQSAENCALL